MKVLKTIGIVLLALVAIWLIAAAIMPKHFEYERSTDINASKDLVFSIIDDVKTMNEWGPWQAEDPTIKTTFGEKTTGVGASYSWTSKKSGSGSSTVTESTPPTYQKSHLEFEGEGGGEGWFKLEDAANGATKTSWGMSFDTPFPFNAFMALMGSGSINKMFDTGLANLKAMAEKKAAEAPASTSKFKVNEVDFPGQNYLGIREKISFDQMANPDFYGQRLGQIMGLLEKMKMEMAGPATNLYYTWDEANKMTDMAVVVPIKTTAAVNGKNISSFEVPAGKALVIDYYGAYEGVGEAHYAMDDYLKAKGLKSKAPVLEQYITNPEQEPDTSKWLTKVVYLVEGPMAAEQ